ncbi:hypothetical protein H5410_040849 [Solanum commersonii]|uniref:Uncharacterized protein n=1 Tax=Solanum commersonii TaxID=4109 RepID=A0A9J5XS11_SOLCO|nr:hypothetical protein H5410_040849 [Solanum commersonii]
MKEERDYNFIESRIRMTCFQFFFKIWQQVHEKITIGQNEALKMIPGEEEIKKGIFDQVNTFSDVRPNSIINFINKVIFRVLNEMDIRIRTKMSKVVIN